MNVLLQMALAGTSRVADAAALNEPTRPALLIQSLGLDDRQRQLLLRAGAEAVYRLSGQQSGISTETTEPAPAEQLPIASERLAGLLQAVTGDGPLYIEFLKRLQAAGRLLPPDILPAMLDTSDTQLRTVLRPVLGERGRWLSQFRDDWRWGAGESSDQSGLGNRESWRQQFEEGALADRHTALAALRGIVPDEARQLLADVWKTEKAEVRTELLAALAAGLSAADEPFLESALDDRAASVRQAAADLLAGLPGSALAGRMLERAGAMFTGTVTGLLRKHLVLHCSPPEEIDKDWQRDGIPANPPAGFGKRAFWAARVLAAVPPTHWTEHFHADPPGLVAAIAKDDFASAVVDGWTQATTQFAASGRAGNWPRCLADYWAAELSSRNDNALSAVVTQLANLFPHLSPELRESIVGEAFSGQPPRVSLVLARFLPLLARPWSDEFSSRFLGEARRVVARQSDDVRTACWSGALELAAVALPEQLLAAAAENWQPCAADTWQARDAARSVERFIERTGARRRFVELLQSEA